LANTYWRLRQKDSVNFFGGKKEFSQFELVNDVVRGLKTIVQDFGLIHYGYEGGEITLRGAIIRGKKYGDITVSVEEVKTSEVPFDFELKQNYPNPFNGETKIPFKLSRSIKAEISIYDITGEKLRTVFNGKRGFGAYVVSWNGKNDNGDLLPSGIYFIVMQSNNAFQVQKAVFVK
jgi:hypothetical protein